MLTTLLLACCMCRNPSRCQCRAAHRAQFHSVLMINSSLLVRQLCQRARCFASLLSPTHWFGALFSAWCLGGFIVAGTGCGTGQDSGKAVVWNLKTNKSVKVLGVHKARALAYWHPTRAVLATACHDLVFWLPPKPSLVDKDVPMSPA